MLQLAAVLPLVGKIIDRVWPDTAEADKARLELARIVAEGELETMAGQLEINKQEAAHKSLFVAGWRPFIGWVCGISFAYHFIGIPILTTLATLAGVPLLLPAFDMQALLTVLMGMLGLGGLKTFEKIKGVAREK